MARRPQKPGGNGNDEIDAGQILEALREVTEALKATNRRLDEIAALMARATPGSLEGRDTAAAFAPALEAAAPGAEDELVLRSLAQGKGLAAAMERLISYRNQNFPASRPRYWGIINFHLHSKKDRLFVFDVAGEKVSGYLCAHGRGSEGASDDGMADLFSNVDGSNASSLGIYRCAETYQGDHGYSMRLDGLESTNSNARHRAIVVHGADYVSKQMIENTGRIGRSKGCPAVENQHVPEVVDALKSGSLLLAWKS